MWLNERITTGAKEQLNGHPRDSRRSRTIQNETEKFAGRTWQKLVYSVVTCGEDSGRSLCNGRINGDDTDAVMHYCDVITYSVWDAET